MKTHAFAFGSVALAVGLLATTPSALGHGASRPGDTALARLGKVEFKVDCTAAVQPEFNRAMALYHSFAWGEAMKVFDAITRTDPACGMAHWGRAMVMLDNPFIWPGNLQPAKLKEVAAALDAARAAGLKAQREKDYVEAVAVFVRDYDKIVYRTRLQSFDETMAKLAARNPDDKEASILSALVTSANFDPADKTYANQLKATKVLEPLFIAQPNHPGVAHYLIHSYDYPPIAKHGLRAAKRYAKIAPDATHALHMPSHIFTRVGHWRDSIKANRASAEAAGDATFDGHHAYDYMVYAHLQLAQDRAARKALEKSRAMKPIDHFGAAYAYAAMPARFALERGDWKGAAKIELHPGADTYPWNKYPQAEAVSVFARGVGAARSGNGTAANEHHARLIALRDVAKERKLDYWAGQIDIQADLVRALAVVADGKRAEGIKLLRAAAAREDATEKHAVTPGPLLPAREMLAEALLEARRGPEALREFEAVLTKEPNRYRATLGAAKAARLAGNGKKARRYSARLLQQAKDADTPRSELKGLRQQVQARSTRVGKQTSRRRVAAPGPGSRRFNVAASWRRSERTCF
jgi:hypothetical protein